MLLLLKSESMPMMRAIHLIVCDEEDDESHVHYDDDTTTQVLDQPLIPFWVMTTMDDRTIQLWEKDQRILLCDR